MENSSDWLIDLGCLYGKQTQRAFNVFKTHTELIEIDSIDERLFENSMD
jgi:hypothetical protein